MAVKLIPSSVEHAEKLIKNNQYVVDDGTSWHDHKPTRTAQKTFFDQHGFGAYAHWHLGEDDEIAMESPQRYKFPYGDFKSVHRCAVLAIETRAGEDDYWDIQEAAGRLRAMLDALK